MEKSISGHGTFIYSAEETIKRYGSAALVAEALKECDMQHAWVRIHGAKGTHPPMPTEPLIDALKNNGISVAGWGWCQGDHVSVDVEHALTGLKEFKLDHYIADIEDGVSGANWTVSEVREFFELLRTALPDARIGVSSFGFIPWHKPKLMQAAEPFVDFFAPQVYWFSFPTTKMLKAAGVDPSKYPLDSPVSYAQLCLDVWRKTVKKPIVLTGQAYWGESPDFTQSLAESKLKEFVENFKRWETLQGLNWWHFGGKGQKAMSFSMYQAIKAGKLNSKFRKT